MNSEFLQLDSANFNGRFGNEGLKIKKKPRVETCRASKQQLETDQNFLSKAITDE